MNNNQITKDNYLTHDDDKFTYGEFKQIDTNEIHNIIERNQRGEHFKNSNHFPSDYELHFNHDNETFKLVWHDSLSSGADFIAKGAHIQKYPVTNMHFISESGKKLIRISKSWSNEYPSREGYEGSCLCNIKKPSHQKKEDIFAMAGIISFDEMEKRSWDNHPVK